MTRHISTVHLKKILHSSLFTLHLAAALLLLLLTGCNTQPRRYVIGVSQCSVDNWRDKFNEELMTAALITDSLTVRLESANDNDQQQMRQINQMIDDGVDLLIISPNQIKTISGALDRAHEKGIPVILYDRKANTEKYTAFIGCDNYLIGKAMGQHIAQRMEGHGRVAEITGLHGSSPAIERHKGFQAALKDYPGITTVATESGDWKEQSGAEAMSRILKKTTNIDYVFVHNDRMALGAQKAAKSMLPQNGIRFTGVDALAINGGGLEMVRDGVLDASYLYPTKGNEVITLAMKILTHRPFERENYLQTSIVTKENAALSLMEAKDAERQRTDLGSLHKQVDSYVANYKSQKVITVALVIILALLIAVIVLVYRSLMVKARHNEELADSNRQLQQLNNEVMELTHSRLVFFTNVSHELRTPLTLILDPLERLMEDDTIKTRNRNLLELIRRNAESLQQLVDSILDFRKLQNGKMKLTTAQVNLPAVLQQWVENFMPTAERQGITLTAHTSDFPFRTVTTDQEKLARIVYNLLSNALKYTPAGGEVTVALSASATDRQFTLSVSDTGKGIAPDEQGKVFERFFQAKGAAAGTGIGLAVVKSYTELMGGQASVESTPGQGTEFRITLPIYAEQSDAQTEPTTEQREKFETEPAFELRQSSQPASTITFGAATALNALQDWPRLLVIDDNADIRSYIRDILSDRFHVLEAENGQEGLKVARREVPDLIVCDVMMPVMDGLQVCQSLKTNVATSHIPIIMLTAKALDEQRAEGYEHGADSYIIKPFKSALLTARIDNLLRQRALLREHFAEQKPDEEEATDVNNPDQHFLRQLRTIIDSHLSDSNFNVESIGQEIGLSRVQLYRKVKALTGTSVVDLLRKARLHKAHMQLQTGHRTISEVAYGCGFSSPSYFTKCFREEYGCTPQEVQP